MALSQDLKNRLVIALTDEAAGQELAAAVNAAANVQAAHVAVLGALTPAIDQASTNTNINALQAKIDAVITALKNAGLMA